MARDTDEDKIGDRGREQLVDENEDERETGGRELCLYPPRTVRVRMYVRLYRRNERIHFCPGQKHAPLSPGTSDFSQRSVALVFFERSMVLYEHKAFERIRWELVKPVRDNGWRKNYTYITEA